MTTYEMLRRLQSRIDKRSNEIVSHEHTLSFASIWEIGTPYDRLMSKLFVNHLRKEQTLDKRMYGFILNTLRENITGFRYGR